MAHKQFTKDDIVWIEKYFYTEMKTPRIVEIMGKKQPVYDVINFFKEGRNAQNFWQRRKRIELSI